MIANECISYHPLEYSTYIILLKMGKFSNKSKAKPSKRKTLKQKYKI